MDRREELEQLCVELDEAARVTVIPLIGEIVFLENQLAELKQYPFISVNPNNSSQQKPTPAAKQYKEFLQQYNNCIRILLGVLGKIDTAETSPLRQYLQQMKAGVTK